MKPLGEIRCWTCTLLCLYQPQNYLYGDDDDLEQLQAQFEWLPSLGVVFVTGAHKEVLQFPPERFLLLLWARVWGSLVGIPGRTIARQGGEQSVLLCPYRRWTSIKTCILYSYIYKNEGLRGHRPESFTSFFVRTHVFIRHRIDVIQAMSYNICAFMYYKDMVLHGIIL